MTEAIMAPEIEIVDPHHHLPSGWMDYPLALALADYDSGHRVRSTVHVEAHCRYRTEGPELLRPVGETEGLVALAHAARAGNAPLDLCAGIVGYVDLTRGAAVGEALDAHIAAGEGRFRGIRANFYWNMFVEGAWQPSAIRSLADHEAIRAGIAELAPRGLSCDLVAFHPNLPDVARLADRSPDTIFIVNHLGAPMDPTGTVDPERLMDEWRAAIGEIAARPNIRLKLGGLTNEHLSRSVPAIRAIRREGEPAGSEEIAAAYLPLVSHAIDTFGPGRCMFESNFPVDKRFTSFRTLWNAFKRLAASCVPGEEAALLGGTAASVYRV